MLKRFMSWLLHRLQKLLSPLSSGRRHHSHSPMPAQDAVESGQGKAYVAPSEGYPEPEPEPSSLGAATALSSQTTTESEDTLPVESDIYLSVDAAAATQGIPFNPNAATAASELIASGALNYLLESPNTSELPEIHDLLPALEPEESVEPVAEASTEAPTEAASAELDTDETPAEEGLLSSPSLMAPAEPVEQETDQPDEAREAFPEENIEAAVDPPAQAVLFRFDIVESEPAPVEAAVPESSVLEETPVEETLVEETPAETFYPGDFAAALSAEAIADDDYSSKGSDDAENLHSGEDVENPDGERLTEEFVVAESAPAALETGQIEIVIEIADPEANDPAEPILVSDSQSPEVHSSEVDSSTASPDEAIDHSRSEEPVKQGVVKLLFTLKQGNFHGYIAPDDGSKDILFHQKYINADIFDQLERGTKVVAAVKYIEGKAYATRVDLL